LHLRYENEEMLRVSINHS